MFTLGILGDWLTHKYPLYRAYIGISHRATLVVVHPTISWHGTWSYKNFGGREGYYMWCRWIRFWTFWGDDFPWWMVGGIFGWGVEAQAKDLSANMFPNSAPHVNQDIVVTNPRLFHSFVLGWMDGSPCFHSVNGWIVHLSRQFIATFPAGWSPPKRVFSKGILPKTAETFRLRIYNKLPRFMQIRPQKNELKVTAESLGRLCPGRVTVRMKITDIYFIFWTGPIWN